MRYNRGWIILITLIIQLLWSLSMPKLCSAQTSFSVNPVVTLISTHSQVITKNISITNLTNANLALKTQILPFKQLKDGSASIYTLPQADPNIIELIKDTKLFDKTAQITSLVLQPQEKKDIVLKIDMTQNHVLLNNYNFSVLFSSIHPTLTTDNQHQVKANLTQQAAIASLFLVTSVNPDKNKLIINLYTPSVVFSPNFSYRLTLDNQSQSFAQVYFSSEMGDILGRKQTHLNNSIIYILDHSKRSSDIGLEQPIRLPISWFGPVTMNFTFYDKISQTLIVKKGIIWILPIKLIFAAIVVFMLIIVTINRVKSRILNKNIE